MGETEQVRRGHASEGAPFATRMAQAWRGFQGPILLLLAGDDVTAQEFADHAARDPGWRGALAGPLVQRVDLPHADHTFSDAATGPQVLTLTLDWLRTRLGCGATPDSAAPAQ